MNPPDKLADERFLKTLGCADRSQVAAPAVLILINAAAAVVFALSLTLTLTGGGLAWVAGVAIALIARAAASAGVAALSARHARVVITTTRARILRAMLGRRRGADISIGEATSAVAEGIEGLDGYFSRYAPARLEARLTPLVLLTAIALASPVAAGLLVATLVPFIMIMALAGGAAGARADEQFEALARLSGRFVDRVRALPVVVAFQAEAVETAQVARAADDVADRTLGVLRIAFISTAALEFFAALSVAMLAVYAGFALLGLLPFKAPESLDFFRAFFALALAPEFYAPMRRLAGAYHEKQLGEAAAARLRAIVEDAPALAERATPLDTAPSLRLEGLTLRLGDVTIGPIDAHIPAGRITAIVGPTGSGKSSLLSALAGLTPAHCGSVRLGSGALDEDAAFAHAIAWAGQTPVFIPGTVLENLMVAGPAVSKEAALAMMAKVGLGSVLDRREAGAALRLDERGSGLSGGERRRLALGRALLNPSRLLLLDEPTADLDAAARCEIIAMIRQAAGDRTVVVATHSPALAEAADRVLRLP